MVFRAMVSRICRLSSSALFSCFLAATSAVAWEQPRIVNGVTSHDFATTGQLLYGYDTLPPGPIGDDNQGSGAR
jgi:hypothetical protein